MDKEKVISEIFDAVLNNGIETSKNDILGEDINDRVYTKRININKDYEFKNSVDSVEVVCVSMTCVNEDMSDAAEGKVRINMKNRNNSWVNIFLHEAPDELIDFIHKNIHWFKFVIIMAHSLEKINREFGAKLRGEYGTHRGNEIIRSMAEAKDRCKYPLWSRD